MAILVTGGAGYIGSAVAREFLRLGEQVVVLDNLSTGSRALVPHKALFEEGSISNGMLVERLLAHNKIEEIVHCAASVDVAESMLNPGKYYFNNTEGTRDLLFAAKKAGVKRFIFSSTAAVYGNPDQVPIPEDHPVRPESEYGKSKALAEDSIRNCDMSHVILRYFNVAGGGYVVGKPPSHLIRRAVLAALGDIDHLDIFGTDYPTPDGSAIRDFIHVQDIARVHASVLKYVRAGRRSSTFNVGYGKGCSVLEVVRAVERVIGKELPTRYQSRRHGDVMTSVASNQRLIEATSWEPMYNSLDKMIRDELGWVTSQKALAK